MGTHLCLQTPAGHFQRSIYSSIKLLESSALKEVGRIHLCRCSGWFRAGRGKGWLGAGNAVGDVCGQKTKPLFAEGAATGWALCEHKALPCRVPAQLPLLCWGVKSPCLSLLPQELLHMGHLCGGPAPRSEPLPCQGTLSKAGASPRCCRVTAHTSPGCLQWNISHSAFVFCSGKQGLTGGAQGPLPLQFFFSISPPCRTVPALMLFVVRKKGNNSISYSDIAFSAPLKACMCLHMLLRAAF